MKLLGGRAGYNNVMFESDTHTSTATRKGNDIIVNKTIKDNKETKLENFLYKIPFVRAYWIILKIIFTKFGLLLLALSLIYSYCLYNFEPSSLQNSRYHNFIILPILMLLFNKCSKTKYYHGAEHKVVNDYEKNGKVSIETAMNQSCVNDDCGTNLYVGLIIINGLLVPLVHSGAMLLGWGITYEIMRSDNKIIKLVVKSIYFVGSLLQKYVFTSEPSMDQLEVAVMAFKGLEDSEKG